MAYTHRKAPGKALGKRRHDFIVLAGGRQVEVPKPPAGLLASSERRWDAFWRSPVAEVIDPGSDMPRLERWIKASDEFARVTKLVKETGRMVLGSMGQPVLNPLYALLRDLDAQLVRVEAEFGMTPMARLRLGLSIADLTEARQRIEGRARQAEILADHARRAEILGEAVEVEADA
jgi:P27 family predicted phage terminase small subunit